MVLFDNLIIQQKHMYLKSCLPSKKSITDLYYFLGDMTWRIRMVLHFLIETRVAPYFILNMKNCIEEII
jgi:hypothetical protein